MKRWMQSGIVFMLALSACAKYEPSSIPARNISPADIGTSAHGYALGAEPYADPEQQKKIFDADFQEAGIVVLNVIVQNRQKQPVLVRRSTMLLTLPDGSRILPTSAHSAAIRVGEDGSQVGATLAFGLIGGLVASDAEDTARDARISDYEAKEFKEVTLGPNESAHGFVFFTPAPGIEPFDEAKLAVRFVDVDTAANKVVAIDVTGIDFVGAKPSE